MWLSSMDSPPASACRPGAKRSWKVITRPPTRSRASSTVTSHPLATKSRAHANPAKPAPTTTTEFGGGAGLAACRFDDGEQPTAVAAAAAMPVPRNPPSGEFRHSRGPPLYSARYDLSLTPCQMGGGTVGLIRLHDAVMWDSGKLYFFGDRSNYLRYDVATDRADPGYPKPLSDTWKGWPWADAPTGAVEWGNGKAYFFYGYSYSRYDMASEPVEPGYPKRIEDLWPGMFAADVQSAINWGNGKAFFFSGSLYIRYDIASGLPDPGYPRSIAEAGPACGTRHLHRGQLGQRQGVLLQGARRPVHPLGHRRQPARSRLPQAHRRRLARPPRLTHLPTRAGSRTSTASG